MSSEEKRVDIGVLEPCESWRLKSRFFPCKVGGKPAWLDLENIPSHDKLKCKHCESPCTFLCQIYAPCEENESAFHRTLFIFVCRESDCCKPNDSGNFKVFRSQLERLNKFYPSDPPEENENWRTDIDAEKWVKTCQVCGILAPSHCAKCKQVNYCCREHQKIDWKEKHKLECGSEKVLENCTLTFPEYEIIIEAEDDDDEQNDVRKNEEEEIKKYENLLESGQAGTFQDEKDVDEDLLKMAKETEDKTFEKFKSFVSKCPDQILRYERGGNPLFISPTNKPTDIPNCSHCGGERQFEFQIMPQLINYLGFEDALKSLDWGVLLFYTCKNSCSLTSYSEEFVWKQDIVMENK